MLAARSFARHPRRLANRIILLIAVIAGGCAAPALARQDFPLSSGATRLSVNAGTVQLLEGRPVYWLRTQPQQAISLSTESGTLSVHHTLARTELDCAAQSARVPTTEYFDATGKSLRSVTNPQAPARKWPQSGDITQWNHHLCHLAAGPRVLPRLEAGGEWAAWQDSDGRSPRRELRRDGQGAVLPGDIVVVRESFQPPRDLGGMPVAARTSASVLDCKSETLETLAHAAYLSLQDAAAARARFRSPAGAADQFKLFDSADAKALCAHLAASQAERDRAAVRRHTLPPADKADASKSGHVAQARYVAGKATVQRDGATLPLAAGASLRSGDVIQSGPDAEVHLVFIDGALMSVRKNTQLQITDYAYDPPGRLSAAFNLVRGTVRSITGMVARRSPEGYRIQTRLATIGVRGTDHEPYVLLEGEDAETPPGVYNKVNKGESTLQPVALTESAAKQAIAPGRVGFVRDFAAEDAAAKARGEEVKPRSPLLLMPSLIAVIPRIFVPAPNEKGFEALAESTEAQWSR